MRAGYPPFLKRCILPFCTSWLIPLYSSAISLRHIVSSILPIKRIGIFSFSSGLQNSGILVSATNLPQNFQINFFRQNYQQQLCLQDQLYRKLMLHDTINILMSCFSKFSFSMPTFPRAVLIRIIKFNIQCVGYSFQNTIGRKCCSADARYIQ